MHIGVSLKVLVEKKECMYLRMSASQWMQLSSGFPTVFYVTIGFHSRSGVLQGDWG